MTTTKQALRPFSELQIEAATGFAMQVFADPASSTDHRDAARQHLMRPSAESVDWSRVPLARRHQILLALDDLKRLAEDSDCFAVEVDNQSEFARAYQSSDGRISPGEFGLLSALRLTPLERRARWDDLDLAEVYGLLRVGGVQLAPEPAVEQVPEPLPAEPEPVPVLNPFSMPLAEQVETSAADFLELDLPGKKPKLEPKPANRRLADHELTGEASDAVKLAKRQQFREGVLGSRR